MEESNEQKKLDNLPNSLKIVRHLKQKEVLQKSVKFRTYAPHLQATFFINNYVSLDDIKVLTENSSHTLSSALKYEFGLEEPYNHPSRDLLLKYCEEFNFKDDYIAPKLSDKIQDGFYHFILKENETPRSYIGLPENQYPYAFTQLITALSYFIRFESTRSSEPGVIDDQYLSIKARKLEPSTVTSDKNWLLCATSATRYFYYEHRPTLYTTILALYEARLEIQSQADGFILDSNILEKLLGIVKFSSTYVSELKSNVQEQILLSVNKVSNTKTTILESPQANSRDINPTFSSTSNSLSPEIIELNSFTELHNSSEERKSAQDNPNIENKDSRCRYSVEEAMSKIQAKGIIELLGYSGKYIKPLIKYSNISMPFDTVSDLSIKLQAVCDVASDRENVFQSNLKKNLSTALRRTDDSKPKDLPVDLKKVETMCRDMVLSGTGQDKLTEAAAELLNSFKSYSDQFKIDYSCPESQKRAKSFGLDISDKAVQKHIDHTIQEEQRKRDCFINGVEYTPIPFLYVQEPVPVDEPFDIQGFLDRHRKINSLYKLISNILWTLLGGESGSRFRNSVSKRVNKIYNSSAAIYWRFTLFCSQIHWAWLPFGLLVYIVVVHLLITLYDKASSYISIK